MKMLHSIIWCSSRYFTQQDVGVWCRYFIPNHWLVCFKALLSSVLCSQLVNSDLKSSDSSTLAALFDSLFETGLSDTQRQTCWVNTRDVFQFHFHHRRDWRHTNPLRGHVMATGACPVLRSGRRVGHQIAASGLRVFLEHALPVALQAWLAEHLSAMCRAAGWADPQPSRAAKWVSCTNGRPSGISGLIYPSSQYGCGSQH